jgi:hypothetical protein
LYIKTEKTPAVAPSINKEPPEFYRHVHCTEWKYSKFQQIGLPLDGWHGRVIWFFAEKGGGGNMRKRNLFLVVGCFFLLLPMTSWATVLTLDDAMLLLLEETGQSSADDPLDTRLYDVAKDPSSENGVQFIGTIDKKDTEDPTISWIRIGATLSVFQNSGLFLNGWSEHSDYSLNIANDNENTWQYALYTVDADGMTISPWTEVPIKESVALTMGMDSDVTEIGFLIGGNVPLPEGTGGDYTFETKASAAPVPEPATILLMGTGLVGLGGWARKRHFKSNKTA